jgi:hypothetical protein
MILQCATFVEEQAGRRSISVKIDGLHVVVALYVYALTISSPRLAFQNAINTLVSIISRPRVPSTWSRRLSLKPVDSSNNIP